MKSVCFVELTHCSKSIRSRQTMATLIPWSPYQTSNYFECRRILIAKSFIWFVGEREREADRERDRQTERHRFVVDITRSCVTTVSHSLPNFRSVFLLQKTSVSNTCKLIFIQKMRFFSFQFIT